MEERERERERVGGEEVHAGGGELCKLGELCLYGDYKFLCE